MCVYVCVCTSILPTLKKKAVLAFATKRMDFLDFMSLYVCKKQTATLEENCYVVVLISERFNKD